MSSRILGVGIATLDIINLVEEYPAEDDEVRAVGQYRSRGGNTGNTLTVLSGLGHDCSWLGTLADDADGHWIREDMQAAGIDTGLAQVVAGSVTPTSYVAQSGSSSSRTIIHYRDLPELDSSAIDVDFSSYEWIHLEGRNIDDTLGLLERIRSSNFAGQVSIEIEKNREGIEQLFGYADVLLFSKVYVSAVSPMQPGQWLESLKSGGVTADLYLALGENGAMAIGADGHLYQQAAFSPARLVDTLGAGDTFNAGVIDACLQGLGMSAVLERASRLAGIKCGMQGLSAVATTFLRVC